MELRVCIDPGHGMNSGAQGYVQEDIVNLAIARAAKDRLKHYWGCAVTMTRAVDNINPSLRARVRIANESGSNVFVSIHCNAAPPHLKGQASGFESYVYPKSEQGARLQDCVHTELGPLFDEYRVQGRALEVEPVDIPEDISAEELKVTVHDRGKKVANFYVLRNTLMPAILCECLFVDHPWDAELLQDPEFIRKLAYGIADGVARFLGLEKPEPQPQYICSPEFRDAVEYARAVGLSAPPPGHDYRQPLSEERLWAIMARILRWYRCKK